ncbi:VOC family protein [Kordiimonas aestuarii]|uniref:glyoxalase/bleomycin resistance/dioxygenase family protein n=1 Tax=Kordiimonas aestuarii TaxID=1005925 RepID=UPI0021D31417|nr:glyoxalase/bleomycin resistance/dioxygenase family protein [Kordiimonas aestuarii]
MKRLHVHVDVKDIDAAIIYYSAMFGAEPVKVRDDYAKWAPKDLAVNFAVSKSCGCGSSGGVGHLGVEVQSDDDLATLGARLSGIEAPMRVDGDVSCCYAKSKKAWSQDPAGVKWELFRTYDESDALAPASIGEKVLTGFK